MSDQTPMRIEVTVLRCESESVHSPFVRVTAEKELAAVGDSVTSLRIEYTTMAKHQPRVGARIGVTLDYRDA